MNQNDLKTSQNKILDSSHGILFADSQAKDLNKLVEQKIDKSLFLFFHYTPDIIIPPNPDGQYLMGVSNLYKLVKDSGWVLEKSGKICNQQTNYYSTELKKCIEDIHLLREVQNHNVHQNNKIKIQQAEYWWKTAGISKNRPETIEDYEKILAKLEKLGDSLIKECGNFIEAVSSLSPTAKATSIEKWGEIIIDRYLKEKNLFFNEIIIYMEFSIHKYRQKAYEIILSFFTNDYKCLISREFNGYPLYYDDKLGKKYKKSVDDYAKEKISKINQKYKFQLKDMEDLFHDIDDDPLKYINIFFEYELKDLLNEAVKSTKTLELDSLCKCIIERTITISLKIDSSESKYDVKCFDLDSF
jgi:hypothetical protein